MSPRSMSLLRLSHQLPRARSGSVSPPGRESSLSRRLGSRRHQHRLPRPFAEVGDRALLAQRATGDADVAAVQDQPVVGVALVFVWHYGIELLFDLKRRLAGGEPGTVADAKNVSIDGN